MIKSIKLLSIFIIIVIFSSSFYICFADIENEENTSEDILINVSAEVYEEPKVQSNYAICIERTTNTILYEKNSYERTPMASTTKIMTAILAIEKNNLKEIVTISKNAAKTTGSRFGLEENMKCTLEDLLYGLMLCSRK